IQNFGNKEKLLAENPNALQELQKKVERMNAEKARQNGYALTQRLKDFLDTEAAIPTREGAPVQNYGYEIYQMIWDELKLDFFFQYRQRKDTKFQFQTKIPIALMTFSRLLFPESKLSTYEGKERFVHEYPCNLEQLYRSLSFLTSQKNQLEEHLNKQIAKMINRN